MHFQIEITEIFIKMQQSVPMSQISEINMQQTFHVLQYITILSSALITSMFYLDKTNVLP